MLRKLRRTLPVSPPAYLMRRKPPASLPACPMRHTLYRKLRKPSCPRSILQCLKVP
jgi:hypothetical protein